MVALILQRRKLKREAEITLLTQLARVAGGGAATWTQL